MSRTYDNTEVKTNYETLFFYYKFDLKLINYNFEKNIVDENEDKKILMMITDISGPLKSQ